jgi:RNA dependent RNA polymerase
MTQNTKAMSTGVEARLRDELPSVPAPVSPSPMAASRNNPKLTVSFSALQPDPTSFESRRTSEPDMIFTPPNRQISSNETSFQSNGTQVFSQENFSCTEETADALEISFNSVANGVKLGDLPESAINPLVGSKSSDFCATHNSKPWVPSDFSFRCRYELERVSQSSGINVSDLASGIISCSDDYTKIWKVFVHLAKERSAALPDKGSPEAWASATGTFQDSSQRKAVILSGKLRWSGSVGPDLFDLQLNPLKLAESCRFHRKYGSDRFMVLALPPLNQSPHKHSKEDEATFPQRVTTWLLNTSHEIAGRVWKAYYVEFIKQGKRKRRNRLSYLDDNDKSDLKTEKEQWTYKVYLFAVDGIDFLTRGSYSAINTHSSVARYPIRIERFLSWHIPIAANLKSTDCKAFQRFRLGLTQTIPSVILRRQEFSHPEDMRSPENNIMNDGCARISKSLGREIALQIGLENIPSVFQARIGGAKGLWMVDTDDNMRADYPTEMAGRNFCIEVTDSQLKILPHPKDDVRGDELQRMFEVVDYSVPLRAAALNKQFLSILDDRGVSRDVLKQMLLADNKIFHQELFDAIDNPLLLRDWVAANKLSSRGLDEISYSGGLPDAVDEQIILLLESGFSPRDTPILHERLQGFLKRNIDRYLNKMQIRVPLSAFLFCIADPFGCLEPGEIHVGFSERWNDLEHNFSENELNGVEVLVGRSPALLPSDIQRTKAVFKDQLRHFKDVAVFSTKGDVPLADLLSGGDYDGDVVWLCWNWKIVQHFVNAEAPAKGALPDELERKSVKLSEIFHANRNTPTASEADHFFRNCFIFNLNPSFLGWCSSEHEMVVYDTGSLSDPRAIKLATLAGHLVDSNKQGHLLTERAWLKLLAGISPQKRRPAGYMDEEHEYRKQEKNIIDFLKFWVARPEMDATIAAFHRLCPREMSHEIDTALNGKWLKAQHQASELLRPVLSAIVKDVKNVKAEWRRSMGPDPESNDSNNFSQKIARLYEDFRNIEPQQAQHEWSSRWADEEEEEFSHFRLLRASCLWFISRGGKVAWYLAGEDLCRLHLKATGKRNRAVMFNMYNVYKPDKNAIKKMTKLDEDNDDDVDF